MSIRSWQPVLKWAGVVLLALLFTLAAVHYSRHHGRLATVPTYDDVVYLYSGLDLATAWEQIGFAGWSAHFQLVGSHAPYSELLAAVAFRLCGDNLRNAYIADVVPVTVFLGFLLYFFRPFPARVQFPLLVCFLTLPFASMIVAEFRPDMAWATLLGFTTIYQITRRDFYEKLSPAVITGILAALSLLTKPSTFAMTILIGLSGFGARFVLECYRPDPPKFTRLIGAAALRLTIIFVLTALITFPFVYYFGRSIWRYFVYGIFGDGPKVFSVFAHYPWNYYLSGVAYRSNMGTSGDLLLIATVVIVYLVRKTLNRYSKAELELCALLILVPYFINIQTPIASPFVGGAFYGDLIFTMAFVLGRYGSALFTPSSEVRQASVGPNTSRNPVTRFRPSTRGTVGLAILLLLCVATYKWPPYSRSGRDAAYLRHVDGKFLAYLDHAPAVSGFCLTQSAPVERETILIWALKNHRPPPTVDTCGGVLSLKEAWKDLSTFDVVLTQDTGFEGGIPWLPVEKLQDQIVAKLRSDPAYHLVWQMEDGHGKHLYVFRRDVPAPAAGPFDAGNP